MKKFHDLHEDEVIALLEVLEEEYGPVTLKTLLEKARNKYNDVK